MKPQTFAIVVANFLSSRAMAEDYIRSVCFPDVTPAPPCQNIIDTQSACAPNGTLPIDYTAHQECMCGGGFFANWLGCLQCLYVHGNRSEGTVAAFHTIISSASVSLCTGTPTASFADIFNNISNSNQPEDVSATQLSDLYPSQTAVSLYYTASGAQGPGAITGSATLATKTAAEVTATDSGSGSGPSASGASGSGSAGSVDGTTGGAATKTTSSSSAGAAATQIVGGLLAVVAGGMVMAL